MNYLDEKQKETAAKLIAILERKGSKVKTELTPAQEFWPAEVYHQDYYKNNGKKYLTAISTGKSFKQGPVSFPAVIWVFSCFHPVWAAVCP